tara:strand:- start:2061 stop:3251 length:1191 start_codon:yes stop_codon:yes gene_type:complete
MSNNVLVLGATIANSDSIQSIKNGGYKTFVLDGNKNAHGFKYADKFKCIDITNKNKVLDYAQSNDIDAIIPLNEFATPSSCYVSQQMGLRGPSFLSATCGTDKGLMRDVWALNKISQPKYIVFGKDSVNNLNINNLDYPLIIKPTLTGGGGRGISIVKSKESLMECFHHASQFALNDRFILEDFISGTELTIDGYMYNSNFYLTAMSDKFKPESIHRVATSLYFPANIDKKTKNNVSALVEKSSKALGLNNCAIHAEIILKDDKSCYMVELGLRGGGGHLFGSIIKLHSGIDAPFQLANILLDKNPSILPTQNKNVIYRFLNPSFTGKFIKADFPEWIATDDEVHNYGIMLQSGSFYKGLSDSLQRIGFLILSGNNRKKLDRKADKIEASISYQFE